MLSSLYLTRGELTVSYTVDVSAYNPASQPSESSQIGLRNVACPLAWMSAKSYTNTQFSDNFDKNDLMVLNSITAPFDEASYNATDSRTVVGIWPRAPWNAALNYGFYFDRGATDPTKNWGMLDKQTYNTGGKYDVVVTYHAIDNVNGTMFATVNGVQQGFWTSPDTMNGKPQYIPVGKSTWGDQTQMLLYETISGASVKITNFKATGSPTVPTMAGIYPVAAFQGEKMLKMQANGSQYSNVPATLELENPANTKEQPIKANSVTWVSDKLIEASMTVRDNATAGQWDVAYWHNDDTKAVARMPLAFKVMNAPPTITDVTPDHSRPNQKVTMTITGTHFRNQRVPMTVKLQRGGEIITGNITKWSSASKVTAEFNLPAGATIANDWTLYLNHNDDGYVAPFYNFSMDAHIDIINPFGVFNWIWLRAPGLLEVVLYSEGNFDVTTIFPLAVQLGGSFPIDTNPQDVNHDGKLDQIFYFNNMVVKLPVGINNVQMLGADWTGKRIY